MNVAIIGYGYWGPNLVRNFSLVSNCTLKLVIDSRQERLNIVQKGYPSIETSTNVNDAFIRNDIDAVVIATPVFTHYDFAKKALIAGKHVLIEKPMTSSLAEAEELIELALKCKRKLMVDHTFLYTSAIQKMKEFIVKGDVGKVNYFDSTRINLGLFQPDVNVLWDLAPHDLSILSYLCDDAPYSVNATGVAHMKNGIENIAYLTLNYSSNMIAHCKSSWSSPVKLRTTLVGGDKKMMVYDDTEPTEKVKLYDTGYSVNSDEDRKQIYIDYRLGDIFIPKLKNTEALFGMASDFINSILEDKEPLSSAELGMNVVKILEASQLSIKNNGKEVILK